MATRGKDGRHRPRDGDDATATSWLDRVAAAAGRDAGGVSTELLGDYLPLLADAAATGRSATRAELEAVRELGRRAAEQGDSVGSVVDLYLSAALRMWRESPAVLECRNSSEVRTAAEAVLDVLDDAVAAMADGHAVARRLMVRREETLRRDLIDDLVRGDADVGGLVERAQPFGVDLTGTHQVLLAAPGRRLPDAQEAQTALERVILDRFGDRDVLVGAKDGAFVVIGPETAPDARGPLRGRPVDMAMLVHGELDRLRQGRPWRVTIGRAYPGAYGIARSYEEAREALTLATRLNWEPRLTRAEDLLIYRVLVRDQPAILDLVESVLRPLTQARGGAQPLLETLEAYFACGGVATEAARRVHLSVRAVTYRLDRVRALTGYDLSDPDARFTLQVAVVGAKLLGWPDSLVEEPLA